MENLGSKANVQSSHWKLWNAVKANVTRDLKIIQSQTKSKTLYVTGISLGGALAQIAFVDIYFEHIFENVKLTTFGSPRVGSKEFAADLDALTGSNTKRYYIKGD